MNYFELHIGDLTEATAHLSMLEDGAYGRLLRKYYATERPLPADVKQVQRLVGARSEEERQAVETVLHEFFELQDDGWHQSRCDAEIASFHERQADKAVEKENAKERQRRARERRKELFETLRKLGQVPPMTTTNAELEVMLSRVTPPVTSPNVTPPVTRDITASQTPITNHQSPDSSNVGAGKPAAQLPGVPPKPEKPKKAKAPEVTLAEWLEGVKARGEKAMPQTAAVFAYATGIGLPHEFLRFAWEEFKAKHAPAVVAPGQKLKRYADWRGAFLNAVKGNWLKLWYVEGNQFLLTTAGQQARLVHQAAAEQARRAALQHEGEPA